MTVHPRPAAPTVVVAFALAFCVLVVSAPTRGGDGAAAGPAGGSVRATAGAAALPGAPAPPAIDCSSLAAGAAALRAGGSTPPAVAGNLLDPCVLAPDEASLTFLSNGSGSGSRVSVPIDLPAAGSAFAQAYGSFSVREWVTGVPCSFEGLSDLEVTFFPPWSPLTPVPSPNWTLWTPAWDLVPAGSCDPSCQNASATVSVLMERFCEDDVVVAGVGDTAGPSVSDLRPGDALTLTLVGSPQGPGAMTVYLNDSTTPSASLAVSLGPSATFDGRSLRPAFKASTAAQTGWGDHGAIALAIEPCPSTYGRDGPTTCNSYSAPGLDAVDGPIVGAFSYFVPAFRSYSGAYARAATASSSGACRTGPAACADAGSYGGDGAYPLFGVNAAGGAAAFGFGGTFSAGAFGSAAVQYPNGSGPLRQFDPTVLAGVRAAANASAIVLTLRASDPIGLAGVEAAGLYCLGSATPTVQYAAASLAGGTGNSTVDGTWTADLPLPASPGTYPVWVRAASAAGTTSAPATVALAYLGGAGSCPLGAPAAPTVGSGAVVPLALGYRLNVSEPSPAIVGVNVSAVPVAGGTAVDFTFGNATTVTLSGLSPGVAYTLRVTARNAANRTSNATTVTGAATLAAFSAGLSAVPGGPLWQGGGAVAFSASAAGGSAPYAFRIDFGDGNASASNASALNFTAAHAYGDYFGDARVALTVTDAAGETVAAPALLLPIWATPLGVTAFASAGDGAVNVSWSPPASPAGPVVRYTVFFTETNASREILTAAGPANASALGLSSWNTTALSLYLAVPNGVTLYADVVAWDAQGAGQLPSASAPLSATPAPLVLGSIAAVAGGPAPFNDSFSAQATSGTNDTVESALYSFPGFTLVPARVTLLNGTIYLNATYTFPGPGTFVVVLHLFDAFYTTAIQTTTVYVSAGSPPSVSVLILNAPTYAGAAVDFEASASGGSGSYTYAWAFGDGTTGTGPLPAHTYPGPGAYTAVLTVTDNTTGGVNVTVVAVEVFQDPTVLISVYPGANGSGSFVFTAVAFGGSGPSTFLWSFGDGSVARGARVDHAFGAAGQYSVNVTATDPAGRAGNATYRLTVAPAPSGGGGGGGSLSPVALALVAALAVAAALLLIAVVYLAGRGRRLPPAEPEPEDGEVSLT